MIDIHISAIDPFPGIHVSPNLSKMFQFRPGRVFRSQEKRVKTIAFPILGGGIFRGCRSLKEVVAANLRGICAGAYEGWRAMVVGSCRALWVFGSNISKYRIV